VARTRVKNDLVYMPLGGAGEIGMNLYLYGTGPVDARKWIIVDCGIGFAGEELPGIDVILPDITYLDDLRGNILAIVLTHSHEDHIGAITALWSRMQLPVYATPFTAAMLRTRLEEADLDEAVSLNEIELGSCFLLGPFSLEYVTVTHSIPEPNALLISCGHARILHTGDWKIDERPVMGAPTDKMRLRQIGAEGCDVLVCDSTNVFREGASASETDVAQHLTEIITSAKNRVAVATFSSNVARILSVVKAARAAGRDVVVAGRSLHRVIGVARETGWLEGAGQFFDQNEAKDLPRDKTLILLTGSQGEPRAALARVAKGMHPNISLEGGDLIIFSAKTIPGNEVAVGQIKNLLAAKSVEIIDADRHLVHVTGHPRREELKQMYKWTQPRISIPMHGEMRHLVEHAHFALECGVKNAFVVPNGTMLRLAPGKPEVIDEVASGCLLRDGDLLTPGNDPAIRERRKLSLSGVVFIAIAIDGRGNVLVDPDFELIGIPQTDARGIKIEALVERTIDATIDRLPAPRRRDPDYLSEMVRRAVRSELHSTWGKRTDVRVSVTQI
jgi:ribonuclease J